MIRKTVCFLAMLAGFSAGQPVSGAGPSVRDSLLALLREYGTRVDSLSAVLVVWPIQADSGEDCASDTAGPFRLCPGDAIRFNQLFKKAGDLARYLSAHGAGSSLSPRAYADTVLPQVDSLAALKFEFPIRITLFHPLWKNHEPYYEKCLANPILKERLVALNAASRYLMARKYFTGDEGNFIEGALNGVFHLTRTDPDPTVANYGVSPWEFLFRFEPIYLARSPDPQNLGLLLDLGLLRHLFPKVDDSLHVAESFRSRWIRRVGLKGGGGFYGSDMRWVAGGGAQVGILSGWILYDWRREEGVLALGVSNVGIFAKLLPFLGAD